MKDKINLGIANRKNVVLHEEIVVLKNEIIDLKKQLNTLVALQIVMLEDQARIKDIVENVYATLLKRE